MFPRRGPRCGIFVAVARFFTESVIFIAVARFFRESVRFVDVAKFSRSVSLASGSMTWTTNCAAAVARPERLSAGYHLQFR